MNTQQKQLSVGEVYDAIIALFEGNSVSPSDRQNIIEEVLQYCNKDNEERIAKLQDEANAKIKSCAELQQLNDRIGFIVNGGPVMSGTIDGNQLKSALCRTDNRR